MSFRATNIVVIVIAAIKEIIQLPSLSRSCFFFWFLLQSLQTSELFLYVICYFLTVLVFSKRCLGDFLCFPFEGLVNYLNLENYVYCSEFQFLKKDWKMQWGTNRFEELCAFLSRLLTLFCSLCIYI